ncbi:MAG TPA: class I SAM-dependent methyltransferase [Gaiellaceae bacterium]|nr:class I SAM-dependent methyltransferase [Gaiellaceae bacterium]
MPGPEPKITPGAGISSAADVDVNALVERLREELAGGTNGAGQGRGRLLEARHRAERLWAVSTDRPLERRPGPKGWLAYPLKVVLRPFLRWYVEPLAAEQRMFNDVLLKLLDGTLEEVDRTEQAREAAARTLAELEERLTRLERRGGTAAPQTVASQAAAAAVPDYFAFEARMRGSAADVRERQRVYVDDFRDAAPVLDVGCGRGEFLGLLSEAGLESTGIDADADMVAYARGEGLAVEQADALAHLDTVEAGSLGGVFAAQVVEHLPPAALFRFLELSARALRPGGIFVAETINPLSPLALRSYFADLTHAQPLVPETLALLARQAGFREVETRFLNAPRHADDVDERIREILFAPLDYAIVART